MRLWFEEEIISHINEAFISNKSLLISLLRGLVIIVLAYVVWFED